MKHAPERIYSNYDNSGDDDVHEKEKEGWEVRLETDCWCQHPTQKLIGHKEYFVAGCGSGKTEKQIGRQTDT